jgi:hypothetical protein
MPSPKITAAVLALSLLAATSLGGHAMAQQGGVQIGGNVNNTTLVNQNTNAAIGLGTKACSEIGSIGKSNVCD